MSLEYDKYLREHRGNVLKAYSWLRTTFPFGFGPDLKFQVNDILPQIEKHDESKDREIEYIPYDDYFYLRKSSRTSFVVNEFYEAFLMHMHANPHHWQYWVLLPDSQGESVRTIFMPYNYVVEMVCDWFSFSLKSGAIDEIFDYYLAHKMHIQLHKESRRYLETLLDAMEVVIRQKDEKGNYTCQLWYENGIKDGGI